MTDLEIEQAVTRAGGKWDGSRRGFEDADLHPFARALLAAERECIAAWLETQRNETPAQGLEFAAALRALGPNVNLTGRPLAGPG